jgi:methylated-DNA-protein-cysteine methyltransferase-like protein
MADCSSSKNISMYFLIYHIVCKIPAGKVATYGQIAKIVGKCSPRMVGYALASLPPGSDVPWHRVINSFGKISKRSNDKEDDLQYQLLIAEKIQFDASGRVDLSVFQWEVKKNDMI